MTFLEQQLQELQIKKSKVEYFKTLLGLLGGATIDNPIVQKANEEAALEVEAFLNKRIVSIEEGSGDMLEDSTDPSSNQFTKEEVEVLKITAQRLLKKGPEEVKPQAAAPVRRNPQPKGAFDDDDSQEELPRAQNPSSKSI